MYLHLYYLPVDCELSRNLLVDPSWRQVGHPCSIWLNVVGAFLDFSTQMQEVFNLHSNHWTIFIIYYKLPKKTKSFHWLWTCSEWIWKQFSLNETYIVIAYVWHYSSHAFSQPCFSIWQNIGAVTRSFLFELFTFWSCSLYHGSINHFPYYM